MVRLLASSLLLGSSTLAQAEDPNDDPALEPIAGIARDGGHVGLGLGAGTGITGLSLKYMASDVVGVQGVVGGAFGPYDYWRGAGLGTTLDLLFHTPRIVDSNVVDLAFNGGPGASFRFLGDPAVGVGVHGVLGLELIFEPVPIDLVFEYRPGVLFAASDRAPATFAYGDAGFHLRFWL